MKTEHPQGGACAVQSTSWRDSCVIIYYMYNSDNILLLKLGSYNKYPVDIFGRRGRILLPRRSDCTRNCTSSEILVSHKTYETKKSFTLPTP